MSDALFRRPGLLAVPFLCLGLAGCGSSGSSSGQPSAMQTFGNVVMFQSTTPPPADQLPKDEEDERLICPEVIIADGGAAVRAQSGQDSGSLRHQISILNVARECTPTGNGGFRLKVGVEGRVLLGPAGGPGNYGATLTTLVTRGTTQLARRTARVGGTVGAGQGGTDFSHVEDGIVVPAGRGEVEIIVGLGGGSATPARSRRR
ncbi:MAG TPA: hypothetical protein VGV17_09155 [Bosea sp. (in: a-proteobacteria)]|uniref:hypothetical protein n=1 Tax=Bosea sp. (in: a-proteobacteria) TaxID=1871050 RepID=UPI002DDCEEC8|nr:hypothetical protein [Bosea sp. (in: a-proteobacteria)]HEV2553912.1 hypothetical protein [Bosea sp. (in: a-proteobacteria)]